ncbi:thioredoxin family protein [Paraferrimonas haliotis]|uniref:Thioredoxin n=1 Tax=Paraferrimonas haliotis TaxID=2013866 RepID=A0AA37TSI4_9GAMM|nr:thioredoxin family protein [Paraferrimonas haliotis]GLS82284.1 thioredoxin [Paraferrimonas haliotis]
MKNLLALLVLAVSVSALPAKANSGCGFSDPDNPFATCGKEDKAEVIFTGLVTPEKLLNEHPDFGDSYGEYQTDSATLAKLKTVTTPTEVVVIIGTWCPDCHRETPRFIQIMRELNNDNITVKYIGVDRKKHDPENLSGQYEFTRIPTFIFIQNGEEIGRIVERPTVSLEKDMAAILLK